MAVRVIRARNTDPVVTMPTRVTKAAAYCRVSTDSEEQESSYEAQVTHYTNFIQAHDGWSWQEYLRTKASPAHRRNPDRSSTRSLPLVNPARSTL